MSWWFGSGVAGRFARMFDQLVAAATAASGAQAAGAWARVENAACARRLSATADVLEARLAEDGSAERDQWCLDNWDAVAAEIAAAHGVSLGVASHQLMVAMALRERLPRVAEVFAAGRVGVGLVNTIVYRTALITDAQARAKVDVEVAAAVAGWGRLSATKIEQAIDYWVDRHDPYALRRMETRARGRHVDWTFSDGRGASTIEAVLFDHDAATLDKRLDAMARAVCDADERTLDQRRADALGALGAGADQLACTCGRSDCPATGTQASAVVINVIAEEKTLSDDTGRSPRWCPPRPPDHTAAADDGGRSAGLPATDRACALQPGGDDRRTHHPRALAGGQDRGHRHAPDGDPPRPDPTRAAPPAIGEAGPVRALPGHDVPLPGLQRARRCLRPRPHHRLSGRADVCVEPEMPVPKTPPAQDLRGRSARLA